MSLVYFESLDKDGVLVPHTIPREQIAVIRPLNAEELDYSEKLRTGYFNGGSGRNSLKLLLEKDRAELNHTNTSHQDAKSAIQTISDTNYYLPQSVEEFSATLSDLIVLNGDPEAAAAAATARTEQFRERALGQEPSSHRPGASVRSRRMGFER